MNLNPKSRIILALDVMNKNQAWNVLEETVDIIDAIKVNYPIILSCGIEICKEMKKEFNKPIIGDFKIADVPVTNEKIIDISIRNEIDYLMIHGFIGEYNLKEAKEYAKNRIKFFIVTDLTTCTGIKGPFEIYAMIAKNLGFYGVQAPATKENVVKRVRELVGDSLVIISCGVGHQGPKPGDAIMAGADFEIIGRSIYESENPKVITKSFAEMIKKVVK